MIENEKNITEKEPTKIIVSGYSGRMGVAIRNLVTQEPYLSTIKIVAGIDVAFANTGDCATFTTIKNCQEEADVIISFLPASASDETLATLDYSVAKQIPIIICGTGLSSEVKAVINDVAKKVGIFQSPNMSLGINLLINKLNNISAFLYDNNFDIEVLETHHREKLDSPSGTALLLANSINNAISGDMKLVHGREHNGYKRSRDEIGIHALRGGTIIGEHSIIFAGLDEVIEIKHTAHSRDIFAVGALKAAIYMKGKPAGLYNMQSLLDSMY